MSWLRPRRCGWTLGLYSTAFSRTVYFLFLGGYGSWIFCVLYLLLSTISTQLDVNSDAILVLLVNFVGESYLRELYLPSPILLMYMDDGHGVPLVGLLGFLHLFFAACSLDLCVLFAIFHCGWASPTILQNSKAILSSNSMSEFGLSISLGIIVEFNRSKPYSLAKVFLACSQIILFLNLLRCVVEY